MRISDWSSDVCSSDLRMRLYGLEAEGVEIGFQVSAHAVGADQHEGADGIEGGSTHRRVVDAGLARNRRKGTGGGRTGSGGARGAAVQILRSGEPRLNPSNKCASSMPSTAGKKKNKYK